MNNPNEKPGRPRDQREIQRQREQQQQRQVRRKQDQTEKRPGC